HAQTPGLPGDAAEHAPHERALALLVDPGMEVIGDHGEREARVLGPHRRVDQRVRAVLLARQAVSQLQHLFRHLLGRNSPTFWPSASLAISTRLGSWTMERANSRACSSVMCGGSGGSSGSTPAPTTTG